MEALLSRAFERSVKRDRLEVRFASGRVRHFGPERGARVAIGLRDEGAERALAFDPALALGELYMDGRLTLEAGSVYELIALFKRSARHGAWLGALPQLARMAAAWGRKAVSPEASRRNVAHHYDLDERLYRLFLDADMQYSCAYFERPGQSLEAAQLAKKRHLAAKLLLSPGQRVLDMGSGWGGLGLYLADVAGVDVTGITLSEPQRARAAARAEQRRLAGHARFLLRDYRQLDGCFDRIVSVGMFEHVGLRSYPLFFQHCARLLADDGVLLLHSIGRTRPRPVPSPFLEKYIFPGSYIPALSEVLPAVERAGFLVADIEILTLHYAHTLRAWRERLAERRAAVVAMYDERFYRMWEFYLAGSEVGFRMDRMFVFQLQLTRPLNVVPNRRDYVAAKEAELRAIERAREAYQALP
ncbi:MAG TPA: cyclopropane-fatty-acyl-phospholipid synthase family protein [Polyangiales bacterium]